MSTHARQHEALQQDCKCNAVTLSTRYIYHILSTNHIDAGANASKQCAFASMGVTPTPFISSHCFIVWYTSYAHMPVAACLLAFCTQT